MNKKESLNKSVLNFELENNLTIPKDLKDYFFIKNDIKEKYNENMYSFYDFPNFQSVEAELKKWSGIPDYSNLVNTLENHKECFVFANYMFHMFTYAIRLHKEPTISNDIYVLCGDKYKVVAKSFSDFMELYFKQSIELHF